MGSLSPILPRLGATDGAEATPSPDPVVPHTSMAGLLAKQRGEPRPGDELRPARMSAGGDAQQDLGQLVRGGDVRAVRRVDLLILPTGLGPGPRRELLEHVARIDPQAFDVDPR